jgi:hypothetical protein
MPRAKKKPVAADPSTKPPRQRGEPIEGTHWYTVKAAPEEIQDAVLNFLETNGRVDLVLRLHGLKRDTLGRITTPSCWCANSEAIEKPEDRMLVGNDSFRCAIHGKPVTIRRSLDVLMKTKKERAELLEKHPALEGVRRTLWRVWYAFEAGEHYIKTGLHEHMPSALESVFPSHDEPLRGLVIQSISRRAAVKASENLPDDAPWRENLQYLLNKHGDLELGWHGGPLSSEESTRDKVMKLHEHHKATVAQLLKQRAARIAKEAAELEG